MNLISLSLNLTFPDNDPAIQSEQKENDIFVPPNIFISSDVVYVCEIVIDFILTFLIANIGIVCNLIVIIVFAKQGYKESMNISMTAIAIWDLIKCLAGSLQRMAGPISLYSEADAESWRNINLVVMNYLICFATYVSSVLAAYVAVERCLCVSVPLLVKTLLTPKVTFIAMTSLSAIVFGCFAVIFGIYDIIWVYSSDWNQTIAIYTYNEFYERHKGPLMKYYNLSGVIWPIISFVIIVICTTIIVVKLHKASKFRARSKCTSGGTSTISDRDKQVVKMLVVIIAIYVMNLSPRIALYLAKYLIYDLYFLRKYHNIFMLLAYILFFFDLTNATVNLFVFWVMSSNFKATAKEIFFCGSKKKTSANFAMEQIQNP